MSNHHYEFASYGEPLDVDDKYVVTVYRAGHDRVRYRFERRVQPIVVKRQQKLDRDGESAETDRRPTT